MSSPQSLFKATIYMFTSFFLSVFLAFALGMIEPAMTDGFTNAGALNLVHPEWADQSAATSLRASLYLIPYLMSSMGIVYFIVTAVRRQRYDQYGNAEDNINMKW